MLKHLREQSKAKASAKLSRLMGKGGAKDATSGDGASKVGAKAKRSMPISVEGSAAKARLDRPGRKMRRADGGRTDSRVTQDDEKDFQKIKGLKEKVADKPAGIGNTNALTFGAGLGTALHMLGRSKWSAPVRGLIGAGGLGAMYKGGKGLVDDSSKFTEAQKAEKELKEMGVGRKTGGAVKKR